MISASSFRFILKNTLSIFDQCPMRTKLLISAYKVPFKLKVNFA
ncbi:hypothetical protein HPHPH44_0053 [Helicobacter pylori Hp H-44]|nr:hypothetical protein HPHPH44_0053 [Helicobacter pylori Hp H-44]